VGIVIARISISNQIPSLSAQLSHESLKFFYRFDIIQLKKKRLII
jgi:hypothetical protein